MFLVFVLVLVLVAAVAVVLVVLVLLVLLVALAVLAVLAVAVFMLVKGSLEAKLPRMWADERQRWEETEKRREEKRREEKGREGKVKEEKVRREIQKKEDPGARKGRKVAKHSVFPMICGSGGSKSRLAKAASAEPAGQMRDETLHAVVARSTFGSQNIQNRPTSENFWKLKCQNKSTPFWHEAHLQVKMYKTHHVRSTFRG